ncbi:MAG: DUF2924 domain-containing protein [Pseudomonadota bacterium]
MGRQQKTQLDDLRIQYRDLTGFAAPSHLRAGLLRSLIKWHINCALRSAPASEEFFYRKTIISEITAGKPDIPSILMREYGGRVHVVRKTPKGQFRYNGQTFRSLSAVAKRITGIHRSGPNFFRINRHVNPYND